MAEMRGELVRAAFHPFEQPFYGVPISIGDVLKSEGELVQCGLEPGWTSDENQAVGDVVVLGEFSEELFRDHDRSDGKVSDVQEFAGCGIDGDVQPVALVVALNHRFVDGD